MRSFRQFSSHVPKSHACPGIGTLLPIDTTPTMRFAKTRNIPRHVQSGARATQNDDGGLQSAAPATKSASHLLETSQRYYCASQTKDFRHAMKHVAMSQSATPAARNPVARRLKPPKVITFSALPICTAIASSSTVANGCQRLPTVTNGCGHKSSVERTHINPQTPKVKRKPFATHSRKTTNHFGQHRPSYLETEVIVCSKYIYIDSDIDIYIYIYTYTRS